MAPLGCAEEAGVALVVGRVRVAWDPPVRMLPGRFHAALWRLLGDEGDEAHARGDAPWALRSLGPGRAELAVWGRLGETLAGRLFSAGRIWADGRPVRVRARVLEAGVVRDLEAWRFPDARGARVGLRFVSPTAFRVRGERVERFDPGLFWRGCAWRLRRAGLARFARAAEGLAKASRVVGQRTRLVRVDLGIGPAFERGFVGEVVLAARGPVLEVARASSRFGVGIRTALGMGAFDVTSWERW